MVAGQFTLTRRRVPFVELRSLALGFCEADIDSDGSLSFEEFVRVIPAELLTNVRPETLREVFEMADTDGDGTVSQKEFFFWALLWATDHTGVACTVDDSFRKYDTTGDGSLNLAEFTAAVGPFGYADAAGSIFAEILEEGSGKISYTDLVGWMKRNRKPIGDDCRKLLTQMAFADHVGGGAANIPAFDQAPWTAATSAELRETMRVRMEVIGVRPFEAWQALLLASRQKFRLSRSHLSSAMRIVLGCIESEDALDAAFSSMDEDCSGRINFADFVCWINDQPGRRRATRALKLPRSRESGRLDVAGGSVDGVARSGDGASAAPSAPLDAVPCLDEIDEWSPGVLRGCVQALLASSALASSDLLSAYDCSKEDGQLSKREYLVMIKRVMREAEEDEWSERIKPVALDVFDQISGSDSSLDIEELVRWLCVGSSMPHYSEQPLIPITLVASNKIALRTERARKVGAALPASASLHMACAGGDGTDDARSELQSVQAQLRAILRANAVRVIDLFRDWDADENGSVSRIEFQRAVASLGYDRPLAGVDELFDEIDSDGDGTISYRELHSVLRSGGGDGAPPVKAAPADGSGGAAVSSNIRRDDCEESADHTNRADHTSRADHTRRADHTNHVSRGNCANRYQASSSSIAHAAGRAQPNSAEARDSAVALAVVPQAGGTAGHAETIQPMRRPRRRQEVQDYEKLAALAATRELSLLSRAAQQARSNEHSRLRTMREREARQALLSGVRSLHIRSDELSTVQATRPSTAPLRLPPHLTRSASRLSYTTATLLREASPHQAKQALSRTSSAALQRMAPAGKALGNTSSATLQRLAPAGSAMSRTSSVAPRRVPTPSASLASLLPPAKGLGCPSYMEQPMVGCPSRLATPYW